MRVYRIEREKYLRTTMSGIGASMSVGSRWNSLYTRMIYTAESRALAMLEVAVHLDLSEDLPTDRYIIEMEISDDAEMLEVRKEDLPDSWSDFPPNLFTQSIGDEFVRRNEALVLKVPSCIVPDEFNYLINPNHKSINEVQVVDTIKVGFDGRLGGRKV